MNDARGKKKAGSKKGFFSARVIATEQDVDIFLKEQAGLQVGQVEGNIDASRETGYAYGDADKADIMAVWSSCRWMLRRLVWEYTFTEFHVNFPLSPQTTTSSYHLDDPKSIKAFLWEPKTCAD